MSADFEAMAINADLISDWSERLAYMRIDQRYLNTRIYEIERKINAAAYLLRAMAEDATNRRAADLRAPHHGERGPLGDLGLDGGSPIRAINEGQSENGK